MFVIPLSGAAIGFFTNWIAIKMLFRPHGEKRLFGVVLPFTPGVMPKRRADLARKLGNTVGEHILTGEALSDALASPENAQRLRSYLDSAIDGFLEDAGNSRLSVKEFVCDKLGLNCGEVVDAAAARATAALQVLLGSRTFKDELVRLLHEQIVSYIESGALERKLSEYLSGSRPHMRDILRDYLDGKAIPDNLLNNDTPISEYLGENLDKAREALADAAVKHLPKFLESWLRDNEALDEKLEGLTRQIIDDSLGSVARIFVNPSKVYASIKENLMEFLSNEVETRRLADDALSKASAWLHRPVGFYAGVLAGNSPFLWKYADAMVDRLADFLIEKSQSLSLAELLESHFPSYRDELRRHMDNHAETAAAALSSFAALYLESRKDSLLRSDVSAFARNIRDEDIVKFKSVIFEIAGKAPERLAPFVTGSINISGIVESQINAFDIAKVESLVLSVIRRELGIVIALGGVLGFVIGLVAMLAQGIVL
ncbi:MAG: DUF445 family protein [Defluviitaleaceae bacterium]|nr:DUF445 family protein [Defluviitaleaceae bacterium]